MDPVDYREERVSTGTAPAATPVATPTPATAPGVAPVQPAAGPYVPTPAPAPTSPTRTYASRTATYSGSSRLAQFIWLVVGIVDAIIALDFIFRAAGGANTGFAHYVYRIGGWLSAPFAGIFTNTAITNGRTFIRWADVLAVVIYTLAALAVVKLVRIVATPRAGTPV